MYCIKCGKKLTDGAKFCIFCGAAVYEDNNNEASAAEYIVSSTAATYENENVYGDNVADKLENDPNAGAFPQDIEYSDPLKHAELVEKEDSVKKINKNSKLGKILIIIIAIIIIVVCAAIILMMPREDKPTNDVDNALDITEENIQSDDRSSSENSSEENAVIEEKADNKDETTETITEEQDNEDKEVVIDTEETDSAEKKKDTEASEKQDKKDEDKTTTVVKVSYDSEKYGNLLPFETTHKPNDYLESCAIEKIYAKRVKDGIQFTVFYKIPGTCIFEAQIGAYNEVLEATMISAQKEYIQFTVPAKKIPDMCFCIFRFYEVEDNKDGRGYLGLGFLQIRHEGEELKEVLNFPASEENGKATNLNKGKGEKTIAEIYEESKSAEGSTDDMSTNDSNSKATEEESTSTNSEGDNLGQKLILSRGGRDFENFEITEVYAIKDGEYVKLTVCFEVAESCEILVFSPPNGDVYMMRQTVTPSTNRISFKIPATKILSAYEMTLKLYGSCFEGPDISTNREFKFVASYETLKNIARQ